MLIATMHVVHGGCLVTSKTLDFYIFLLLINRKNFDCRMEDRYIKVKWHHGDSFVREIRLKYMGGDIT